MNNEITAVGVPAAVFGIFSISKNFSCNLQKVSSLFLFNSNYSSITISGAISLNLCAFSV